MSIAAELLDPYSFRARLQPALLGALPFMIGAYVFAPVTEPLKAIAMLAAGAGGALFLSHVVRDLGVKLEPRLYARWGGKPSAAMLRHRDRRVPPETKRRYHEALSLARGVSMPTHAEEVADALAADRAYDDASEWLRARTRSHEKFPLIFAENVSYGFRRNLLGAKPIALCGCAMMAGALLACISLGGKVGNGDVGLAYATVAILAAYGLTFLAVVHQRWVRRAAEAYAQRLLEAAGIAF